MAVEPQLPAEGTRLTQVAPRAFQHPADKAASAALAAIPQLDRVIRKLIELGYERALRQNALGSSVRLSEAQLPDVWSEHAHAYSVLDMGQAPPLYMTQFPIANAMAIGAKRPLVVVNSELVALLDAPQRRAVFAHEAAHILSEQRLTRLLTDLGVTHPLPVRRTHELMKWVRGGDYDRIAGGDYPKRDEPASARGEGGEAVGAAGGQLSDWLRRSGPGDDADDA